MSYNVYPTPDFKKQIKKLNKKHRSIKSDVSILISLLEEEPTTGTNIGEGLYKVRMAITSKKQGKSGGARVITYLITEDNELYLVAIYDKSLVDNLTKKQINELLKNAGLIE